MPGLFQDTLFGIICRGISRGRLFPYQDDRDEALRSRYLEASERNEKDLEDGKIQDFILIEYLDNDADHPQNWSISKKCFVTFQICLLAFSIYIGSAIYSSGLESVTEDFHVSQTVAILGLTLYVVGYGCGPMVWAPLSEIPMIGRSPVYILTLLVFVFFNFGVVYAKNIGMLLAFRFLTGLFGSPVLATGGASLADMFRASKRAYPMAVYGIANVCGPTIGPVIGNWAAEFRGWKWTIWELIWMSGFALVFLTIFLPETSADNIIYRRTARLRKHQPTDAAPLKCQPEIIGEQMQVKDMVNMTLVRPFTLMLYEPIVLLLNLYIALIYAVLYCWLESLPIAFSEIRGFSLGITGLCYLGLTVGGLLVLPPFFYYNYFYVEPRFNGNGDLKPEIRLETALVGCFFLPVCLFFFGWTAQYESVLWIVPVIATGFFTIGAFLSFLGVLNYLGDAYPTNFASISAGNDFMRSGFGAAFPLFANQMFHTLGVNWGNSLLGFLAILFIPVIFYIWWNGEKIRMGSKNARHDI
ncbi:hypothetical protein PRZ48_004285 [Zasmidium cellare]|uniref:Major facilitator superfamily (MFS) profile domain-containing protein n=1 Tax=Zasmidium cellare TaxID=395010 RepID=A0ABR0EQE3_ZASCE|nr:hypothetical protein PRZ48_004285 [Zasmidium cellare]